MTSKNGDRQLGAATTERRSILSWFQSGIDSSIFVCLDLLKAQTAATASVTTKMAVQNDATRLVRGSRDRRALGSFVHNAAQITQDILRYPFLAADIEHLDELVAEPVERADQRIYHLTPVRPIGGPQTRGNPKPVGAFHFD
ncbi:hypothetical protein ALI144C_27215 [Actinosynnema sp. ALI-1.44]|nr:hypothetical protein ALI144C_27215 [Actinosynnema sp. ALI-1.44]